MYTIVRTKDFDQSLWKLVRSGIKKSLQNKIERTIEIISLGDKLPANYRDHKLQGESAEYRECHIQGDLLLVYQIHKQELILILINIGTHSQLFG